MTETALDKAHAAMEAAPEDGAARMKFYEALADTTLFLLLTREAEGGDIEPETFEVEGNTFLLGFDLEERLVEFTGAPAPYVALSGRGLAEMLKGQDVGLGLNLDLAPSSALLPAEAVDWLADMLAPVPEEGEAAPEELLAPALPETLLAALDARLAKAGGLARAAWLAGVRYEGGGRGHLLAIFDAAPGAEAALAKAVSEALRFSGLEAGALDVTFLDGESGLEPHFARVGLRFDLPEPERAEAEEVQIPGSAPGMDPSKPPKLK